MADDLTPATEVDPWGCLICGRPVAFPQYTLLCNACDKENLDYANGEQS